MRVVSIILLLLLGTAGPVHAARVPWLYEVTVPVADQSSKARLEGAGVALKLLLTRLTGLVDVPMSEPLAQALKVPDRYFSSFNFNRTDDDQLELQLRFVPRAVLALIEQAALPLWGADRPRVMSWVVVDDGRLGGDRTILAAAEEGPLTERLLARSRERGLDVQLPIMDLDDQLSVDASAVWGGLSGVLEDASARYGAELILVGRVERFNETSARSSWDYFSPGFSGSLEVPAGPLEAHGDAVMDRLANELSGRMAIVGQDRQRLTVTVSGIESIEAYAELLRYFRRQEVIQDLQVAQVQGSTVTLAFATRSAPDRLADLLSLGGRLERERAFSTGGFPRLPAERSALQFRWR